MLFLEVFLIHASVFLFYLPIFSFLLCSLLNLNELISFFEEDNILISFQIGDEQKGKANNLYYPIDNLIAAIIYTFSHYKMKI